VNTADLTDGVGRIMEAFRAQAAGVLNALGVADLEGFETWAKANEPDAYRRAAREHALLRRTEVWKTLGEKYMRSVDVDPRAVSQHIKGARVIRSLGNGDSLIYLPGRGETSLKVARRMGWV
jgi:hypothetical protein